MKIGVINVIVSVIVLIVSVGVFYNNRHSSDITDDVLMYSLLKNAEVNAHTQWKSFVVSESLKRDTLSSYIENLNSPVLMLRVKETSCQTCVSNELDKIKELKENGIKCVLLATYSPSVIGKLLRIKHCKDVPVFQVPNDFLYNDWYAERFESPYYFVLHPNKKASDFFLPEKTKPELTEFYIQSVAFLLGNGISTVNNKYL